MTNAIASLWAALEEWCAANRTELLEGLNGPAARADLDALVATGLSVPRSLLDSLARHDGESDDVESGIVPTGGLMLPAARIIETHDMLRESLAAMDDNGIGLALGPVRTVSWNERWLPIADYNGDVTWFLDFDPAPGGVEGQVIRVDLENGEWAVCAPSFEAYLSAYLDDLRGGRVFDDDGELRSEQPWPPIDRLPALQAGSIDATILAALGEAGRWDDVMALLERVSLEPAQRLRFEAQAALQSGDTDGAMRALDALPHPATTQDLLLRADVHEWRGAIEEAMAALEPGMGNVDSAALRVRRAKLLVAAAERPPGGAAGFDATLKWAASPAGQQAAATARERAVADYDAAIAADDRDDWRLERVRILLDAERWDDAATACRALLDRDDPLSDELLEEAESLLERATARGADQPDADDILASMDELLETLAQSFGSMGDDVAKQLQGTRDSLAGLRDVEAEERARLDAEPDSKHRRAREIAQQLARIHVDTPERFVPFDSATLDAKARRWYDGARNALEAQGYLHCADVEPVRNTEVTGNRVMLRAMLAPDRRTAAAAWRLAGPFATYEVVELESELDDGRVLITNNAGSTNPFAQPQAIEVVALPPGATVDLLLRTHESRLAAASAARTVADLDAVLALQERQRVLKREAAHERGWVSESELRSLLGASYHELAEAVREELARLV